MFHGAFVQAFEQVIEIVPARAIVRVVEEAILRASGRVLILMFGRVIVKVFVPALDRVSERAFE